tara:strand:- start:4461 stop:5333 length:873 start_codon:yes stop_codon:yes gene_type:complete
MNTNQQNVTLEDLEVRNKEIQDSQKKTYTTKDLAKGMISKKSPSKPLGSKLHYSQIDSFFYGLWQRYIFEEKELSKIYMTDHNMRVVRHILMWMTRLEINQNYEKRDNSICEWEDCDCHQLDRAKGIFLWGDHGRGKTKFMKALVALMNKCNRYYRQVPKVHSYDYRTLFNEYRSSKKGYSKFYSDHESIFMDDLAWRGEDEINDFGNKQNLVARIIQNRHAKWEQGRLSSRYREKKNYSFPLFTCNISFTDMNNRYGEGISDRLKEMCNIIHWDGEYNLRIEKPEENGK